MSVSSWFLMYVEVHRNRDERAHTGVRTHSIGMLVRGPGSSDTPVVRSRPDSNILVFNPAVY
jgi:hypothetical protein